MTTSSRALRNHSIRRARLALIAVLCLCSGCYGTTSNVASGEWTMASPEGAGFDPVRLGRLTAAIRSQEYPNVHALLIERGGHLVYEEYFDGEDVRRGHGPLGHVVFDAGVRHDIRSVTKSVTSALVGIALGEGLIESVDQPLLDFFPEHADLATPEHRRITLRHALTMSAGLAWDEAVPYSNSTNDEVRLNRSADPVRYVLSRPVVSEPGTMFNYNGGLTQVLATAVQRRAGRPLLEYARDVLFAPLGVTDVEWVDDGHDVPSAASGLRMRPRDLAKFGSLYGSDGRWNGSQVIPSAWVVESTRRHVALEDSVSEGGEHGYGYQWWHDRLQTSRGWLTVVMATGNGGQRIFLVPELDLVVTVLGGRYNPADPDWVAEDILEQHIIPAVQ